MNSTENGKRVTLVYEPHGRFPSERAFDGLTDDDIAFVTAGLVGRRFRTEHHDADMEELKAVREDQLAWYRDQMMHALITGLGAWARWLPARVLRRIVETQTDYLSDMTATWIGELIGMHSEVARRSSPIRRPRSATENGPRIHCTQCPTDTLLAVELPEGWTKDADGLPHCPEHPAVSPDKEQVAP